MNIVCITYQIQQNLIALPMLLCTEDDVEGESYVQQQVKLMNNELFYIMTRGISYKEAVEIDC